MTIVEDPPKLLGNQRPRLEHRPLWVSTLGEDAVALSAHAGLHLDPWEADVLTESLGRRKSGKWSALEVLLIVPRQNGKGAIIEARQLAAMFLTKDATMIYSAHQFKTAKAMYKRIRDLCQNTPDLHKRVLRYPDSNDDKGIVLPWGQLHFFARSSGSGRGFTGSTMFFDEAFDLDGEMIADMLPTLSAVPSPFGAQVWYASSAGKAASDTLASLRARGIRGDALMLFLEWSNEKGVDLDSVEAILNANPGIGYHLDLEYILEVERANMSGSDAKDEQFGRERHGIWADAKNSAVFERDLWAKLHDAASRVNPGELVYAVDVEFERTSTAITVASPRPDGRIHLEVIDERPGVTWAGGRLREICAKRKPIAVVLDAGGPAATLIEPLTNDPDTQKPTGIPLRLFGTDDVKRACAGLVDAYTEDTIRYPVLTELDGSGETVDAPMTRAALAVSKRTIGDGFAFRRRDSSTPIAPMTSAAFARYGLIDLTARPREKRPARVYAFT